MPSTEGDQKEMGARIMVECQHAMVVHYMETITLYLKANQISKSGPSISPTDSKTARYEVLVLFVGSIRVVCHAIS